MPPKRIPLSEGLEQVGDDSMGTLGSLNRADNAEYVPSDEAIWKRRGRRRFNASPEASRIYGAHALAPITTSPPAVFVVGVGTKLRTAAVGTSGSFADAVTGLTGGVSLCRAHLDRHFVLGNGVDRARVYGPDFPAWGTLGIPANASPPTISRDGGSGTGFTLASGKTVQYWIEERVKVSGVVVKRGSPTLAGLATLTGDGTLDKPLLTRPTLDSETTHWALFGTATNDSFPVGAELGEVVAATTTIEDTRTGADPGFPTGTIYQTVNVTIAGLRYNVPLNGPPPIFDTAEVFEDCLCVNSKADGEGNWLWFSFTRKPHAFPSTNALYLGDGETDPGKLRVVRSIGKVLVCLLENQVWVVFQLPHPNDKLYQIERVKEKLAGALGVVGPQAAARFVFADRDVVAWVSHEGVMLTDGNGWDWMSDDLDWESLIEPAYIQNTVLVYNPKFARLEMLYTPVGGTTNTKVVYLHVHPTHLKRTERGIRPKVTGPIDLTDAGTSAFSTVLTGRYETFYATEGGYLVQTNIGSADEDGSAISFAVDTNEYYLAGEGYETAIRKAWIHHSAAPSQTLNVIALSRNEGQDDDIQNETIPLDRRELTKCAPLARGSSHLYQLRESSTSGRFRVDYIVVDLTDVASEKSRGSRS